MALYQAALYGPNFLPTSAAAIYDSANPTTSGTSQATNVTILKQIIVCNTDSTSSTFTLYIDISGAADASDTVFSAVSLGAGETKIINTSIVLRAAQNHKVYAQASVSSKVTMTLAGLEEY